jgi:hypothetical protein
MEVLDFRHDRVGLHASYVLKPAEIEVAYSWFPGRKQEESFQLSELNPKPAKLRERDRHIQSIIVWVVSLVVLLVFFSFFSFGIWPDLLWEDWLEDILSRGIWFFLGGLGIAALIGYVLCPKIEYVVFRFLGGRPAFSVYAKGRGKSQYSEFVHEISARIEGARSSGLAAPSAY